MIYISKHRKIDILSFFYFSYKKQTKMNVSQLVNNMFNQDLATLMSLVKDETLLFKYLPKDIINLIALTLRMKCILKEKIVDLTINMNLPSDLNSYDQIDVHRVSSNKGIKRLPEYAVYRKRQNYNRTIFDVCDWHLSVKNNKILTTYYGDYIHGDDCDQLISNIFGPIFPEIKIISTTTKLEKYIIEMNRQLDLNCLFEKSKKIPSEYLILPKPGGRLEITHPNPRLNVNNSLYVGTIYGKLIILDNDRVLISPDCFGRNVDVKRNVIDCLNILRTILD